MIQKYKKLSELSGKKVGVDFYAIGDDFIRVQFISGNVETMKVLAGAGRGLSTFIAQNKQAMNPTKEYVFV